MRLRYWATFFAFSILLHVAIFWPLPAPPAQARNTPPLIVSLPKVRPVDLISELEQIAAEDHDPELNSGLQLEVQASGVQPETSSKKSASLKTKGALPRRSSDEALRVESKMVKLEMADGLVNRTLQELPSPSISTYCLALGAEVIRKRASIEKLVTPEFKGKLVVLVLLRGPNAVPQVSLEESAGSEPLDREVLAAFRRAAEVVPVSMAGNAGEVSIRLPVHFDQAVLD